MLFEWGTYSPIIHDLAPFQPNRKGARSWIIGLWDLQNRSRELSLPDHGVIKASAHSFKQFTSRLLKLSSSLSMHIYNSDGRHAWFHLHGTSRPDRSASEATKYKMKNSLSIVGLEPSTLRFQVWCCTYWASRAWWMLYV